MDQTESLKGSVKSVGDAPLALNTTAPVGFFIIHGDNLMEPPRRIFAKLAGRIAWDDVLQYWLAGPDGWPSGLRLQS
jgi:hypothetical protein